MDANLFIKIDVIKYCSIIEDANIMDFIFITVLLVGASISIVLILDLEYMINLLRGNSYLLHSFIAICGRQWNSRGIRKTRKFQ